MTQRYEKYIPLMTEDSEEASLFKNEISSETIHYEDYDGSDLKNTASGDSDSTNEIPTEYAKRINLLDTSLRPVHSIILNERKEACSFGRSTSSCDHLIDDPRCSRVHFKISLDSDNAIRIEDASSSNGTYLNNDRITTSELRPSDCIRVGRTELFVDVQDC